MKSKNKPAPTKLQRRWIEMLAAQDCVVCGSPGPSEVHEFDQGEWFTAVPLCTACHRLQDGWHGTRQRWKNYRVDQLEAIGRAVERNFEKELVC